MCISRFLKTIGIKFLILTLGMTQALSAQSEYVAKDFSYLYEMKGFTHYLLETHFILYQGYVKNTNKLLADLKNIDPKSYEFGAMKRRVGWEFDGMRLHELYFGNLGGNGLLNRKSTLYSAIVAQFGSFETWKKSFVGVGMIRGVGWSVLYLDPIAGRLFNMWINEHDLGHLAGGAPVLIMDVWEHAYMPEWGLDRAKYIEVFFKNIDWNVVSKRYQESLGEKD